MRLCILTVSDRTARGEREDLSGPLIRTAVEERGWAIVEAAVLADDQAPLEARLIQWCDSGEVDVILTTGGTGFAPRDRVPEATQAVVERQAPGLVEAMRLASLRKTPHAMLSRAQAGIRGRTLIINLPGSPRAVRENLNVILPVLPHAVELLRDEPGAELGHPFRPPDPAA